MNNSIAGPICRSSLSSFFLLLLTTTIWVGRCPAAESLPPPDTANAAEERHEPALVEVFNRPVVVLRSRSFGYTPTERAKRVSERIAGFLERRIYGPVVQERRTEGAVITIGGEWALLIQPDDVDPLAGKTFDNTVQEAVQQLSNAMEEAKLQRSKGYVLTAAAKTAGATFVFAVLLIVLLRLRRRFLPHIVTFEKRLASYIAARGLVTLVHVVPSFRWAIQLGLWVLIFGLTSEWASICLRWFPYTRPWGNGLQENLWRLVIRIFDESVKALPGLMVIVVIFVFARGVIVVLRGFFSGIEAGTVKIEWMDVEAARATRRIMTIIVWLFVVVMIYPYIPGSGSNAFKGMSVFVGLLLSLGSASVVGQFTSGLVLMYSQALKPGEYVRIGDHEGTVESLGFLSTKMRSPKNEEFHVPNTVILGTTVKNYSRLAERGGLLVHTSITIGYDTPWRQVHALLIEAAKCTPGICPEPAPFVLQTTLSDFYVEYQLNAGLEKPQDRIRTLAALHASIQDQFNAHGVQIMSPHYEQDKAQPVVVPREKWFAAPAVRDGVVPKLE